MPRFIVAMCDKNTGEILQDVSHVPAAEYAILQHPWLTDIYTDKWIKANISEEFAEAIISNLHNVLNWSCSCMNLDSEILKDLNGGDSNVSSVMVQE